MKGSEFREIRRKTGLGQHEIAKVFKVARETVMRWENKDDGQYEVPLLAAEALIRLASNPDQIAAIKVLRPPRKVVPYEDRSARRLRRIRESVAKDKNESRDSY